jgi:hypothetical protein
MVLGPAVVNLLIWHSGRGRMVRRRAVSTRRIGILVNNSNIDDHRVPEIFIPRDKGSTVFILEADALCATGTIIETVKVLDGCNDGISGIVREYLHTHGQARTICRGLWP